MISLLFFLFSALFFIVITGGILNLLFKKQIAISKRTASYFDFEKGKVKLEKKQRSKKNNLILVKRIIDRVKNMIDGKTSTVQKKNLEQRLREAGYPLNMSSTDFRFFQLLLGFVPFIMLILLITCKPHI